MVQHNQKGEMGAAVIIAVTMTLLFVGATVFGFWAFAGRQDFKNNAQQKIDAAVEVAKKETETTKDNQFAEDSKKPTKQFQGSATLGSVSFAYPKTYSAYVISKDADTTPINGYFMPDTVPNVNDPSISFALRVNVSSSTYDSVIHAYDTYVKSGKLRVSAFRAAKVPQALGSRLDGQIASNKQGSLILLPLRDKTIEIWTESNQYMSDFNTYVVPSISFVP